MSNATKPSADRKPSAIDPVTKDVTSGVQRRDLVAALLGVMGAGAAASVLASCAGGDPQPSTREDGPLGNVSQASASGTNFLWFDTIYGATPNLKNTNGTTSFQVAVCDGYSTPGDGGGGMFWWDTSSHTGDDGGTIIVPTGSSAGRWRRIYSGALDIRWFGANTAPATDNTGAINNAVLAATATGGAGSVFIPAGTFNTTATINIMSSATNPLEIYGVGYASKINAAAPTDGGGSLVAAVANNNGLPLAYFTIRDVCIIGAFQFGIFIAVAASPAGTECAPAQSSHVYVRRCFVSGATLSVTSAPTAGIYTLGIDDVWIIDNELSGNGTGSANGGANLSADILKDSEPNVRYRIHVRGNRISGYGTANSIMIFDASDSDAIANSICQGNNYNPAGPFGGNSGYGIAFYGSNVSMVYANTIYNNIVANNTVTNAAGMGIYLRSCYSSSVANNVLYDTCRQLPPGTLPVGAIGLDGSNNVIVDGNTIRTTAATGNAGTGGSGIAIAPAVGYSGAMNIVVSNNYIEDIGAFAPVAPTGGLYVQNSCNNIAFIGNVVNNSARGIGSGLYAYGVNMDGVRIVGNSFDTGTGDGIAIGNAAGNPGVTNAVISHNVIRNYSAQSVYVGSGSHVIMTENVIEGLATGASALGIEFVASDSVVELNVVTATNGGIRLDPAATGCRVASNLLDGASGTKLVTPLPVSSYGENNRFTSSGQMRGTVTLPGGTPNSFPVTPAPVEVQAGDTVRLNRTSAAGTLGHLSYFAGAGSLMISSTSSTETSTIEWEIVH